MREQEGRESGSGEKGKDKGGGEDIEKPQTRYIIQFSVLYTCPCTYQGCCVGGCGEIKKEVKSWEIYTASLACSSPHVHNVIGI